MSTPAQPSTGDGSEVAAHTPQVGAATACDTGLLLLGDEEVAPHTAVQRLWHRLLQLLGWELAGHYPAVPKYVLVVAPHTSNWDFVVGFVASRSVDLGFPHWLGKDSLFRWPLGSLLRKIGGISVDRSGPHQFVDQVTAGFAQHPRFILTITPEGTRRRTEHWKTGFYYIALSAGVPIVLSYLDYGRKLAGFGPMLMPSGDIEADFALIRDFYADIRGRHPDKQGEVRIRLRTTNQ